MSQSNETKDTIKQIKKEFEQYLSAIGKKYGYTLDFGNGSFDSSGNFSLKLNANKDGALSKEAQQYEFQRSYLRLPPLGTLLNYDPSMEMVFRITGLNARGTKVIGVRHGKSYLLPVNTVRLAWKIQQSETKDAVQ